MMGREKSDENLIKSLVNEFRDGTELIHFNIRGITVRRKNFRKI